MDIIAVALFLGCRLCSSSAMEACIIRNLLIEICPRDISCIMQAKIVIFQFLSFHSLQGISSLEFVIVHAKVG